MGAGVNPIGWRILLGCGAGAALAGAAEIGGRCLSSGLAAPSAAGSAAAGGVVLLLILIWFYRRMFRRMVHLDKLAS